eukprot:gene22883-30058_t
MPRKASRALLEEETPFTIQRTNPEAEGFDQAWVDSETWCTGQLIYVITNNGNNTVNPSVEATWTVNLPRGITLANPNSFGYTTTAGVGEFGSFTMTNIGYYMSPAGTSGNTAHSAFVLTLRCPAEKPIDWSIKCSCPGLEDVAIYQLETSTFEFDRADWFTLPLITPDSSGSPAPVRSLASTSDAVGAYSRKLVEEGNIPVDELLYATAEGLDSADQRLADNGNQQFSSELLGQGLRPAMEMTSILDDRQSGTTKPFQPFVHGLSVSRKLVQERNSRKLVDELLYATEGLNSADQRLADNSNQFSSELLGQGLRPAMDMTSILDDRQSGTTKPFQPFVHGLPAHSRKLVQEGNNSDNELLYAAEGLNSVDQLLADNGNQLFTEPPDQALCVGNGFIVEGVNSAMRVRSAATGDAITGTVSLNRFFGYPSEIDRETNLMGPLAQNPHCLYDAGTGKFFFSAVIDDGTNRLELAVSKTSDPTGEWWIYRIPHQNDGSEGTPNHNNGPAFGNSHQIGHDNYGLYFTTNEFPMRGGFVGSNIYAVSKRDLAQADAPAYADADGVEDGTTHMLMTHAGSARTITQFALWGLSGTKSLVDGAGYLSLSLSLMQSSERTGRMVYNAPQKTGDYPLGQSLGQPLGFISVSLNSAASVGNVMYSAGKLWAVVQTQFFVNGENLTTATHVLKVTPKDKKLETVGLLGFIGQHTLNPVVAVNSEGEGAVAFTLVGPEYFPSYAYVSISDSTYGNTTIALEGKSPQDGYTQYTFSVDDPARPRWGAYGAAACDEHGDVYFAGEFIAARPCTQQEFNSITDIVRCGGTRTIYTNWATGIIKARLNGEEKIRNEVGEESK